MKMTVLEDITLTGELAYRIGRNYSRLEDLLYRPESIFRADQQGWPGDWEGRTILALSLCASVTGRKGAWLEDILEELSRQWNSQGYLKEICLPEFVDEQQLSGHNWLLRGLLEQYLRQKDPQLAQWAKNIVENLYLPLLGRFSHYPSQNRALQGGAAGHIAQTEAGWRLSTDIGCGFISMDALAQYYSIFGGPELKALLWEMFDAFQKIDPVACQLQTHATLSALRGILRFYEAEGQPELLSFVRKRFDLYQQQGMTSNYANYNWFGRPTWTEPCAIVDSFMVAVHLFRLTGQGQYMELANRIFYNALLPSQRPNGGFGCDDCAGVTAPHRLHAAQGAFEAYWCCSMRGAEGLSFAAASTVMTQANHLYITAYHPGTYVQGGMTVKIKSRYPRENQAIVSVHGAPENTVLHLYLPQGSLSPALLLNGQPQMFALHNHFLTLSIPPEAALELSFALEIRQLYAPGAFTLPGTMLSMRGDLILGSGSKGDCFLCDRIYEVPDEPCILTLK